MVSVVVPAFNAAGTIAAALASVYAQTFTDYEVIIVDDASTDGTAGVAEAMLEEHAGGRVFRNEQNLGPAGSRNRGIRESSGEWLAFLDGDDVWLPWRLAVQLQAAGRFKDIDLFCGNVAEMEQDVASPEDNAAQAKVTRLKLKDFAIRNEVATSTVLARKRVVEAVGVFDERFRGPEDYDLWIRVAARGDILKCDYPLSRYRDVDGSLSRDDRNFLPQVLGVLDKAYGEGGALCRVRARRRAQAYQYLCAAWMAAERGAHGRALALFLGSLARWAFTFEPYARLPWCRARLLVGMLRLAGGRRA